MSRTVGSGVRIITVAVFSVLACSLVRAEPVDPEGALRVAEGFLQTRTPVTSGSRHALSAAAARRTADGLQAVASEEGTVLAYVAALAPAGFIVTSADTRITPIVAYSLHGTFDPASDRTHPLYLLLTEDMRLRTQALATQDTTTTTANGRTWSIYATGETERRALQWWPPKDTTTTGGWVDTTWHQLPPYNSLCPLDPVDGERSVVGCVATAMAQLLNYHRRCGATFAAGDAYTMSNGVKIDADNVRYDFPSFAQLNELLTALRLKYSQDLALDDTDAAVLGLACGFAAKMDYSSLGSGASSADVVAALLDKFQLFSADMIDGLSSPSMYTVQENVINGLPVLLGIRTADGMSGHLIVCDGYNSNGEYHLNFGWTSSRPAPITEAWYRLPSEIPSTLNAVTDAIVNIQAVPSSIDVDPAHLDFVCAEGQSGCVKRLFIRNNTAESIHVDSISCPSGFTASLGSEGTYADRIESFDIQRAGQEMMVSVKFDPQKSGGYYGTLAVNYSDGKVRYVVLQGDAHAGGTDIAPGDVSGTWSPAGSPYFVLGDIQVAEQNELTIEPGVQVIFTGHYSMTIGADARLAAQGTAVQPILFTAANTGLGFAGLRFVETGDDDVLSYCHITYSKKGVGSVGTEYDVPDLNGGALYLYDCSPTITHCILANNVGDYGGAIFCEDSAPVISNTVIANNACLGGTPQAGGIYCTGDSSAQIDNCTIVNNSPGGLYSEATYDTQVTNTILWGNRDYQILAYETVVAAAYCDVQGGYEGNGNLNIDPAFFDPAPGDRRGLRRCGRRLDAQEQLRVHQRGRRPGDAETDLAGNPRVFCDLVDIGAYENQSDLALLTVTPAGRVDAGFVPVDASQSVTLTMANTGKRDLTLNSVDVNDANGVFSVVDSLAGKLLKPGESAPIEIRFAPTAEKVFMGTLRIRSTADNASDRQLSLRGTGTAGTMVSGSVSGTWTKAESPYTVTGNISVAKTKTLTIEPGVTVRFAGPFSFTVGYRATLKANGTAQEPILFTATNKTEGWLGIRFINAGKDDVLQYCTIEYALKPYTGTNDWKDLMGGAILCAEGSTAGDGTSTPSSPTIDHCLISHCFALNGGAIACMDESKAVVSNSVILDNAAEFYAGGLFIYGYAQPTITHNVIAGNNGYIGGGIYNFWAAPTIVNNTIVHNRGVGMYLDASYYYYFSTSAASVRNNIIWENEIYMDASSTDYNIRYNDVQGGWTGQGNIDVDPLFADSANRDYHLKSQTGRWDPKAGVWVTDAETSPCIDAGDPSTAVGSEPSPNGGRINLGAYGGTPQAGKSQEQN